jgi:hypothetical protein
LVVLPPPPDHPAELETEPEPETRVVSMKQSGLDFAKRFAQSPMPYMLPTSEEVATNTVMWSSPVLKKMAKALGLKTRGLLRADVAEWLAQKRAEDEELAHEKTAWEVEHLRPVGDDAVEEVRAAVESQGDVEEGDPRDPNFDEASEVREANKRFRAVQAKALEQELEENRALLRESAANIRARARARKARVDALYETELAAWEATRVRAPECRRPRADVGVPPPAPALPPPPHGVPGPPLPPPPRGLRPAVAVIHEPRTAFQVPDPDSDASSDVEMTARRTVSRPLAIAARGADEIRRQTAISTPEATATQVPCLASWTTYMPIFLERQRLIREMDIRNDDPALHSPDVARRFRNETLKLVREMSRKEFLAYEPTSGDKLRYSMDYIDGRLTSPHMIIVTLRESIRDTIPEASEEEKMREDTDRRLAKFIKTASADASRLDTLRHHVPVARARSPVNPRHDREQGWAYGDGKTAYAYGRDGRPITCNICGLLGHFSDKCPSARGGGGGRDRGRDRGRDQGRDIARGRGRDAPPNPADGGAPRALPAPRN